MRSPYNPKPETLEKYYRIIDTWLTNGFNGAAAYLTEYPNSSNATAKREFNRIKNYPVVMQYINTVRQMAFEDKCIDSMRITEEIADLAFAPKGDKDVPSNVKLKALEILNRSIKDDELLKQQKESNSIVIELEEEDSDEDNTEAGPIQ